MVFPLFIWRRSSSLGSADAYCLNEQSRRETQGACEAGEVRHVEDLDRAIFTHRGEGRAATTMVIGSTQLTLLSFCRLLSVIHREISSA